MLNPDTRRKALALSAFIVIQATVPWFSPAAGVTLITHGNNSSTTNWATGMANALSARIGGGVPVYRLDVGVGLTTAITNLTVASPATSASGEIIIMLDWGPVSNDGTTTFDVANAVAPLFGQTNLIAELGGHALAEFPLHIMGHSRGGSLVCELSRKLGEQGLWVDQVTGLDTHPISGDAPVATYENVLFADSYYETDSFLGLLDGEPIPGSHWRRQTTATGGYSFPFDWHSDVHLWYHGTIDLAIPTTNGDMVNNNPITITGTMRGTWWTAGEQAGTNAGFIYSRPGGGDRLSTVPPNGADSSPVRDGFNRYYDVGGGAGAMNRTPVGGNSGEWPNPIRFTLLTTNVVEHGDVATLGIYFQWAQPNTSTQSVQVLADPDSNPLNGNEILLDDGVVSGTTVAQVGYGTIEVGVDGALLPAGNYQLLVNMAAAGRSRFLYAPQSIQVGASTLPLTLDISMTTNSMALLGVNGVAGQTAVLELSLDGLPWLPVATNTLASARWELLEPVDPDATLTLFRAVLAGP